MSYPYWPQAAFGYRNRTMPTQRPYFGFGGYTRGSMSPKYDWATPSYVRAEPDGVDGFGEGVLSPGQLAVLQGAVSQLAPTGSCLQQVRSWLIDEIYNLINKLTGGIINSSAASFFGVPGKVKKSLDDALVKAEDAGFQQLINAVYAGDAVLTQWVVDNIAYKINTGWSDFDKIFNAQDLARAVGGLRDVILQQIEGCQGKTVQPGLAITGLFMPAVPTTRTVRKPVNLATAVRTGAVALQTKAQAEVACRATGGEPQYVTGDAGTPQMVCIPATDKVFRPGAGAGAAVALGAAALLTFALLR